MCYWVIISICFIIGLPCTLMSCNEWNCPLQNQVEAIVLTSDFHPFTCSCCLSRNSGEGDCILWKPCDCSFYDTKFQHQIGTCALQTHDHYNLGQVVPIFVHKYTHVCQLPTILLNNIAYVGVVFLVLRSLLLLCALLFAIGSVWPSK